MSLHEALFAAAAGDGHLFDAGRLSLAFVSDAGEHQRIAVGEWELSESTARAQVEWRVPPMGVRIHTVRLYDGDLLVESRKMRNASGEVGELRLLGGMEFVYRCTFGIGEGND